MIEVQRDDHPIKGRARKTITKARFEIINDLECAVTNSLQSGAAECTSAMVNKRIGRESDIMPELLA
jgi:hypothetical protein